MDNYSILLLEDNALDVQLMEAIFEKEQFPCTLHIAKNREQYINALEKKKFDLILADYSLPNMDGVEALEYARSKAPSVPFVIVSGAIGERKAVDLMKRGIEDYVFKNNLEKLPFVIKNVLEKSKKDAELRELQELHKLVIESSQALLVKIDKQGHILFANEKFCSITHLPEKEALQKNFKDFFSDEERKMWEAEWRYSQKQGNTLHKEFHFCIQGKRLWLDTYVSPIREGKGAAQCWLVTLIDITLIKAKERESRIKSEFLGRLSHEICTPLTAILGYNDLLFEEIEDLLKPSQVLCYPVTLRSSLRVLLAIL